MAHSPIDTNVVLRFLVETPETIPSNFRGVFDFFRKLEQSELFAHLPDLVVFQAFFVLTSHFGVPPVLAADKLATLISFRGIRMTNKHLMLECLKLVGEGETDIVDAWIIAWCRDQKLTGVYSFDKGFKKRGLELLPMQ